MTEFTNQLAIKPFLRPCSGEVRVPGSKSLSNRALILAALSDKSIRLEGLLFSRDTQLMLRALRQLGFEIETNENEKSATIKGLAGQIPAGEADLFVGNAGTAARFLTAFLALKKGGVYRLDGDPEMRKRPMKPLLDSLVSMGTEVEYHEKDGFFPFTLRANGLVGGLLPMDTSGSSQFTSALLMVAPFAQSPIEIKARGLRPAFVDMTCDLMEQFGGKVNRDSSTYRVALSQSYSLAEGLFEIEPDVTAASYFIALPRVVGGELLIRGISSQMLQGDLQFIDVMKSFGLKADFNSEGLGVRYESYDSNRIREFDFNKFSDTFLTLAAIAPALKTKFFIKGIEHTRHQETDRVSGMATELKRLGVEVIEDKGSLLIDSTDWNPAETKIQTYKDHRFAMSFGVLASGDLMNSGQAWIQIEDPYCCRKTFPKFFEVLDQLRES